MNLWQLLAHAAQRKTYIKTKSAAKSFYKFGHTLVSLACLKLSPMDRIDDNIAEIVVDIVNAISITD